MFIPAAALLGFIANIDTPSDCADAKNGCAGAEHDDPEPHPERQSGAR